MKVRCEAGQAVETASISPRAPVCLTVLAELSRATHAHCQRITTVGSVPKLRDSIKSTFPFNSVVDIPLLFWQYIT